MTRAWHSTGLSLWKKEMYPHGSINGSAEKKRLYLIFQPAVLKQRLNSLFVKNNFLMCAGFHGVRRFVKFGLIG